MRAAAAPLLWRHKIESSIEQAREPTGPHRVVHLQGVSRSGAGLTDLFRGQRLRTKAACAQDRTTYMQKVVLVSLRDVVVPLRGQRVAANPDPSHLIVGVVIGVPPAPKLHPTSALLHFGEGALCFEYRGTSLIKTRTPLGPQSKAMPRALWGS